MEMLRRLPMHSMNWRKLYEFKPPLTTANIGSLAQARAGQLAVVGIQKKGEMRPHHQEFIP